MMRFAPTALQIALVLACAEVRANEKASTPADDVDPLIGTDNSAAVSRGNTCPAAVWPFGMTAWTPQTAQEGRWIYRYDKDTFQGFRATRAPSIWMSDYGPLAIAPMLQTPRSDPVARADVFDHAGENAKPYRYAVELNPSGIRAEVVPGARSGFMRFVFPAGSTPVVVLDAFPGGSQVRINKAGQRSAVSMHKPSRPRRHSFAITL